MEVEWGEEKEWGLLTTKDPERQRNGYQLVTDPHIAILIIIRGS